MFYRSLLSIFILLIFSCNQDKHNQGSIKDVEQTDTAKYQIKSFYKTNPDCKTDTCDASVKASYPVFEDKNLNKFVSKTLASSPYLEKEYSSIAIAADSFINEYMAYKKEVPQSLAGYSWEQNLKVAYQNTNIISFIYEAFSYTGGAHGQENTLYFNFNRTANKVLNLNDILIKNYHPELTKIAEEIFRKNEELTAEEPLNGYFFENNTFSLNNNFLITKNGLQFMYNPYEIKAYAFGQTIILIPYQKINHLINENSILAQYINKNGDI